jgi:hypothetical protein
MFVHSHYKRWRDKTRCQHNITAYKTSFPSKGWLALVDFEKGMALQIRAPSLKLSVCAPNSTHPSEKQAVYGWVRK